jgi:uncharacterized protein (PEP-CTERM system associated)
MSRAAAGAQHWVGFRANRVASALVLIGLSGSGPTSAERWTITPSITVTEMLTDNVTLAPSDRKQSDLITQITPGIRIDGAGARVKLNLDYRASRFLYANESGSNSTQNFLNARGSVEAIEKWFFVEGLGTISQQSVSAFGAQPTASGSINANRVETATYRLSPYVQGQVGTTAEYQLRYKFTSTSANTSASGSAAASQYPTTRVQEWVGFLRSRPGPTGLGWAVDGSHQAFDRPLASDAEATLLRGTLTYQFDPQLRVSAFGGREYNNYASRDQQGHNNYGGRVEWFPTDRTQVAAMKEKRFFGDAHEYSVRHRTRLTAWQYSDRKDVSVLPQQLATAGRGTAFDLLDNALQTRFPDPTLRAREVERLLLQNGIPTDLALAGNFLTTTVTVQRARRASVGLLGVRNTVTLAATLTDSASLGAAQATFDDFSRTPQITQRSISADWSHRISGQSSMNVLVAQVHSTGTGALESTQSFLNLRFTHQVAPKVAVTLGARRVLFESSTAAGYNENALLGSLSIVF